jgi:AP endonuclease-2
MEKPTSELGGTADINDSSVEPLQLQIVSWNVAGWKTSVERIKKRHKSLKSWLKDLNADIICLQEVKIPEKEIREKGRGFGAKGDETDDYETFWATPRTQASAAGNAALSSNNSRNSQKKSQQRDGLNGVATFCRKGTVCGANRSMLGDPSLDGEGRCLMTDHGGFVIFNVYGAALPSCIYSHVICLPFSTSQHLSHSYNIPRNK